MRPIYLALAGTLLLTCLAQQPPAQKKSPEQPAKSAPAPAAAPKDIRQQSYIYDVNGRPVPSPGADEQRQTKGAETILDRQESRRDATGKPVTVRSTEERLLGDPQGNEAGERVIQRYDLNGKPTSKQVMRFER